MSESRTSPEALALAEGPRRSVLDITGAECHGQPHLVPTATGVYTEFTLKIKLPNPRAEGWILDWRSSDGSGLRCRVERTPLGLELRANLGTSAGDHGVRAPLVLVDANAPVDFLIRYTGRRLDLVLAGVIVHQHGVARGAVRAEASMLSVGDLLAGGQMTLWDAALEDAEISALFHHDPAGTHGIAMVERNRLRLWEESCCIAASAPHRPAFHVAPRAHWINDPNGLIDWNGRFHVFFQHNPYGPYWGTMHWGHVETEDFVHWTHRPVALAPEWGQPDRDGCFSGCCVDIDGTPTVFYTAVYPEVQCVAHPDESLQEWTKLPLNPVIDQAAYGSETLGFRDPWVWREDDGTWAMIVGSGRQGRGGSIPLYRADHPAAWRRDGDLLAAEGMQEGAVWECPALIRFGPRALLFYSPEGTGTVVALSGVYRGGRFTPHHQQLLDQGPNFYAPQATTDRHGRVVLLGWVPPAVEDSLLAEQRWAGCLTIPRELRLDGDGSVLVRPLAELASLRIGHWQGIDAASRAAISQGELHLTLKQGSAVRSIIELLRSADGRETTRLVVDWRRGTMQVLRDRSSLDPRGDRSPSREAGVVDPGGTLDLRIFIDRSVIEVFANEAISFTVCVYPTLSDSTGIGVSHEGGEAEVLALEGWELQSIWSEGDTA